MCGLWGGYSGFLNEAERDFIKILAGLSFVRGTDSTGITAVTRKGWQGTPEYNYRVYRSLGNPMSFWHSPEMAKEEEGFKNLSCIIGHNRLATVGSKTIDNAQPIHIDDTFMCHNGTVFSFKRGGEEERSDSYYLTQHLQENDIDSVVKEIGTGAAALVWLDRKNNTLNFWKNHQRTLYLGLIGKIGTVFWASEQWMLKVAESHSSLKLTDCYPMASEKHLQFSLGSMAPKERSLAVPTFRFAWEAEDANDCTSQEETGKEKAEKEKVTSVVPLLSRQGPSVPSVADPFREIKSGKRSPLQRDYSQRAPLKPMKEPVVSRSLGHVLRDPPSHLWKNLVYTGWNNCLLSMDELNDILDFNECKLCVTQCKASDEIYWVDKFDYLCKNCYNLPGLGNLYGIGHKGVIRTT